MIIYECPISRDFPLVPVITNEGITYDFSSIARSLLRGAVNDNSNAALDPITGKAIDTLIYNRSIKELNDMLMEAAPLLSDEDRREIASLYAQLVGRYPALRICGLQTLEGMEALIGASRPAPQRAAIAESIWNAAYDGNLLVVRALLAAGVDRNQVAANGATPLYIAAQQGHLPVVNALLVAGADFNLAATDGATPLYIAAQQGHLPVVNALLVAGADFNLAATNSATPFFIAAQQGHLPVVTALLAAGADVNKAMTDGATALYTAVLFGHLEVVEALQRQQHSTMLHPPISIATEQRYPAFVKALLLEESVRDYYLNQIILKPKFMHNAFTQNPVFFTELAMHGNALWGRLSGAAHFNLAPDAHKTLLQAILNSRQMPDETQRHPLCALFSTPQPTRWFSFFGYTANITLDDIQAYTEATYPVPTSSMH